jgi:hypothetical protein
MNPRTRFAGLLTLGLFCLMGAPMPAAALETVYITCSLMCRSTITGPMQLQQWAEQRDNAAAAYAASRWNQVFYDSLLAASNTKTGDVRCAKLTTELQRTTTSSSDFDSKLMAATQLYVNAMAANLALKQKGEYISSLGSELLNGVPTHVFTATWTDGSTSSFFVTNSVAPPQMLNQQPTDSDSPATGDSSCPV